MDWLHNPDEIYRRSFAIVRDEADLSIIPDDMTDIAIRLVHACGMPEIIPTLGPTELRRRRAMQSALARRCSATCRWSRKVSWPPACLPNIKFIA